MLATRQDLFLGQRVWNTGHTDGDKGISRQLIAFPLMSTQDRGCRNSAALWELRPCAPEELSSSRSFVHSFKKSRVIPKRTAYFFRNATLQKVIRMILQEAASPEIPFVSFSGKLNSSTGIQISGKSWPSFENHGHLFTGMALS